MKYLSYDEGKYILEKSLQERNNNLTKEFIGLEKIMDIHDFGYTYHWFDGTNSEDTQKFISMYLGHEIKLVSAYMNKGYDGYYYYRFDYFNPTKYVDEITINI